MFALIAGWGKTAFPGNYGNINDYFWIPIVGPLLGASIAAFFSDTFIQDILKAPHGPAPGVESEGRVVEDIPPPPQRLLAHYHDKDSSRLLTRSASGWAGSSMTPRTSGRPRSRSSRLSGRPVRVPASGHDPRSQASPPPKPRLTLSKPRSSKDTPCRRNAPAFQHCGFPAGAARVPETRERRQPTEGLAPSKRRNGDRHRRAVVGKCGEATSALFARKLTAVFAIDQARRLPSRPSSRAWARDQGSPSGPDFRARNDFGCRSNRSERYRDRRKGQPRYRPNLTKPRESGSRIVVVSSAVSLNQELDSPFWSCAAFRATLDPAARG
jgi:hypothetical protein